MEQLLKITTIPIEYEMKITEARTERRNGSAELEITREKGGLKIKSRPIQLRMDTYEARNSLAPTTKVSIDQAAQRGEEAVAEATQRYASDGKLLERAQIGEGGEAIQATIDERMALPTGDFTIQFLPKGGANIDWIPPEISVEYQMDQLDIDANIDKGSVEFIPGSVELEISQYPGLNIEYVGAPMYVPPSAAERFLGKNVDYTA
jgi:hypothetical protein